ncbi:hypothetical protein LTR37_015679 [Vermiconidia calcicola]|uniref:Uncharacterized protein n=1 Tax=Vermiconidia calcicola TaxID=1690605 RepID=A0ACC3MST4_9PEZI|nr:hypothetical protein LTR37_015679 [Vermiconidia calcicola]
MAPVTVKRAPKRKATTGLVATENTPSPKRSKRTKKSTKNKETPDRFPLLKLPAELRNNVYEKVSEDTTAYISKRTRGRLACSSSLLRVSRQVRDEFLPILMLHASEIVAKVEEFNFRHLVTFLNRLSDLELKSLSTSAQVSSRTIRIELQMRNPQVVDLPLLVRWLKRTAHPTKRGTQIEISYVAVDSAPHSGILLHLRSMIQYLERTGTLRLRDSKSEDEAKKICAAFKKYVHEWKLGKPETLRLGGN